MSSNKAQEVDGVPPEAIKIFMKEEPSEFVAMADKLLGESRFPRKWKVARLVLLPKPRKPLEDPSSYRPLCLLNTLGKARQCQQQGSQKNWIRGLRSLIASIASEPGGRQ